MIESSLETLFRDRLESGALTPSGVRVRSISMHPVLGSQIEVDSLVEFSFEKIPHRLIKAVIELKSRLTPMVLEGAIHQILRYRNELRKTSGFEDVYPMLVAPYISDSVQQRCKEVGVGYMDLNGTFSLIHKDVYIDVVRPAVEFKNPQGVRNVFTGRSRRVVRVLLASPYIPFRLEELASKAAVSIGQVFQVTKRLQELGYIDRTSEGRCLARPRKLLRQFAQELKPIYARKREVVRAFSDMSSDDIANSIAELCDRRNIQFAFTLASGLEPHERNVRQDLTAVYVAVPATDVSKELRLETVGRGPNVILMTPPEEDNSADGGVFYAPRMLSSGRRAVNPVQLYIDFALQPGRGEEQAEFLLDHSLGFHE